MGKPFKPEIVSVSALKDKASVMELRSADFLNDKGEYAKKRKSVAFVRFGFIDGTTMTITRADADTPEFSGLSFKLRPALDN